MHVPMNRVTKNTVLRIFALPACGGLVVLLGISLPYMFYTSDYSHIWGMSALFFIGAFVSAIVGLPLLALVEWRWPKNRLRYVIGGIACSTGIWLLLDMPIFPKDWNKWHDANFLLHYAWRRLIFFSCFGLMSGSLYTGAVALINKYVPKKQGFFIKSATEKAVFLKCTAAIGQKRP